MTRKDNEYGTITVKEEAARLVIGYAVMECYGVVGMSSGKGLKGGMFELLKRENASKGVILNESTSEPSIDIYIVIAQGIKINELSLNIQKRILHELEHTLNMNKLPINIFITGVQT